MCIRDRIAYSQAKIIQPGKKPGDRVNLEVDIVAKYLERLIVVKADQSNTPRITPAFLTEHGFLKQGTT